MSIAPMKLDDYFTYEADQQAEISFPLGGIGTGSIGLAGTGRLVDWEIRNRPDKGSVHGFTHFAIRAERAGETLDTRILHGPFDGRLSGDIQAGPYRSFGHGARRERLAGMPSFSDCTFRGFYPVAELEFADARFPGEVRLNALNPFVPHDTVSSSLPVAMFEFEVFNSQSDPIDYTLMGSLASVEGYEQTSSIIASPGGATTLRFTPADAGAPGTTPTNAERGQLSMTALDGDVSFQHHWYRGNWFDALHVYWQDASRPGELRDRWYPEADDDGQPIFAAPQDHGIIASRVTIGPGETRRLRFFIAWHFPVFEKYWPSLINLDQIDHAAPNHWKTWYATRWTGVEDVEGHCASNWQELWERTVEFRDALAASDLPTPVLDAVSANLSVLKSPTVTRLQDGTLYGFEGCHVDAGSCEGTCTHVWNYQLAVPFLFPHLARSMLDAEFEYNQNSETGGLGFRLALPLAIGANVDRPCADGHFGAVLRVFREWRLSGDDAWLGAKWPAVKRAIAFAWHPGNYDRWDPDRTGVLWGRQHHTLDMELFGPNSWLTGFYLAALLAGSTMARHLGDEAMALEYAELFERGRAWVDENLYRDSYFAQSIDLSDREIIEAFARENDNHPAVQGSISDLYWSEEHAQIKYQIGSGCEIDQVLAQWHASLYGLGDVFEPAKVKSALLAVFDHNFYDDLGDIANPCRVFGVAGESGTVMCSWPDEASTPAIPLPYAQETMHGFEYSFGGALMQVGEIERGIRVFKAVRDRYRGGGRNPWNEIECGSNYARSMSSFAAVPILTGLSFDLSRGYVGFEPKLQRDGRFRCLWTAGGAWGEVRYEGDRFILQVNGSSIKLAELAVGREIEPNARLTIDGDEVPYERTDDWGRIRMARRELKRGDTLVLSGVDADLSDLPDLDARAPSRPATAAASS